MPAGLVIFADGYRARWREPIDFTASIGNAGPPLAIFKRRFEAIPGVDGPILLVPDRPDFLPLIDQSKSLGLGVETYDWSKVQTIPWWMSAERWEMEDDLGLGTWTGTPLAELSKRKKWQETIVVPLPNLLVDRSGIEASLALHRREGFHATFSYDRPLGANWVIIESELLQGLQVSHPDLMATTGGLPWILRKPLYTFQLGEFHAPRDRPRIFADLRIVWHRSWITLAKSQDSTFGERDFSYIAWLHNSGWENHWCDFGPKRVLIEPTNRCNAQCVGCPQPKMQRQRGDMALSDFRHLLEGLAPNFDGRIVLSGMGEPLNNPDLSAMVQILQKWPNMLITSMPMQPPENFPWQALTQIRLSVDAVEQRSFEALRPGCNWTALQNFIVWASEQKLADPDGFPDLGVSFVKHKHNGNMARTFLQYWQKVCTPIFKSFFFRWPLSEGADKLQWAQVLGFSDFLGQMPWLGETHYCPLKRRPCLHALLGLHILWDGTITPCPFDFEGKWALGNLLDQNQSIEEFWRSDKARDFRRRHLTMDFSEDMPCHSCQDWYHRI